MKKSHYESLSDGSMLPLANSDTKPDPTVTERTPLQRDLFLRAAEVFGSEASAWMTKPHDLLDDKSPMEYATDEFSGAKVHQILNAVEYGGVV